LDRYSTEWNEANLQLNSLINRYFSEANVVGKDNGPLLNDIRNLLNYLEQEFSGEPYMVNIEKGYLNYINKLRQILYKHPRDPRIPDLMDLVMRLKNSYYPIKKEIEKGKGYFSELAKTIKEENDDLSTLINKLEKF